MNQSSTVRSRESLSCLLCHRKDVRYGAGRLLQPAAQRQSIDIFHRQKQLSVIGSRIVNLNHIGMTHASHRARFPLQDIGLLAAKGSLFMTRPTLNTYTATRADLVETANDLFDVVSKGVVKIKIGHTYALKDAAQAQTDLEARKTTGSVILLP